MAKTAVVLAGGGSRGAYQIGVWRALRELGISFDIVTGTSVGALNGALMVQGDYDAAVELWENISSKDVMTDILDESALPSLDSATVWATFIREVMEKGGADIAPLENMIRSRVDEERFRSSPIDFALVTVEYPSLKPWELTKAQIPEGMLSDYLLASSACFPAFKTREIHGVKYMDGGYHDNLPISLAQKLGAQEIIAVDLQSVGVVRKLRQSPDKLTVIRPNWNLGPFILFDKTFARRNIALGYLDTMRAFGKLVGWQYAFLLEDCETNARRLLPVLVQTMAAARGENLTLVNNLENTIMRHITHDFSQKALPGQTLTVGKVLTLLAEYCGELFDLDPTTRKNMAEFNQEILDAFDKILPAVSDPTVRWESIPKIIEELKKWDRPYITAYLYRRLEEFLAQKGRAVNFPLLIQPFWKEFAAAFYLLLLRRNTGGLEERTLF